MQRERDRGNMECRGDGRREGRGKGSGGGKKGGGGGMEETWRGVGVKVMC